MNNSYRVTGIKMFVVVLFLHPLLNGCWSNIASLDEYTRYSIGRNIEEKKKIVSDSHSYASRIGWKTKTYQLGNGNWIYVEPDSLGCFIHWEVNQQNIIIGYKLEGKCY